MIEFDEAEVQPDGSIRYYSRLWVGGRDEDGEYEIILDDGPAQGERVYID